MKFKFFFFAAIAFIIAGCTSNDIVDLSENVQTVEPDKPLLHITALFDEPAGTRASLEEYGPTVIKTIGFRWEVNDEIQFCFEQGEIKVKGNTLVSSVSEDKKTAFFDVTVPGGIDPANPYTLYAYRSGRKSGISSGSVLDNTTPTIAILPTLQYEYKATLADQATVFSLWTKKIITPETTSISLSFQHLGSMMTLHLKNVGATEIDDLHSLALQSNPTQNWIINRLEGGGGAQFDMATGNYVDGNEKFSYTLTFFLPSPTLASGSVGTYYLWFVPKTDISTFNLLLVSLESPGNIITGVTNVSKNITKSLERGKNYILFASIEKDEAATPPRKYKVNFTDSSYNPLAP
ncbi:MAG: hypothetical protein VB075_03415 [Petrimonas sp.]|uniref:hypothetical protein n=1 Tax=Petrimonas sp. TaxID=2023866 RepID=UPI002B3DD275|nr:hypothetical protein [Petrimonas sp.]